MTREQPKPHVDSQLVYETLAGEVSQVRDHGFALEGHGIWRPRVTAGELQNRGACARWLLSLAENPFWTKP